MHQTFVVSRLVALATFAIIMMLTFMCHAKSADHTERDSARQQLAKQYFVEYKDCREMTKAFKENDLDELRLFLGAGSKYSMCTVKNTADQKSWDKLKLLVREYPNSKSWFGCDIASCQGSPPISYELTDFCQAFGQMKNYSSECVQFEDMLSMMIDEGHLRKPDRAFECPTICSGFWKKLVQKNSEGVDELLVDFGATLRSCANPSTKVSAGGVYRAGDHCPVAHDGRSKDSLKDNPFWSAPNQSYLSGIMTMLMVANKQLCETGSLKSCKAIKEYNEEVVPLLKARKDVVMKKQSETVKKQEYEKSPQSVYDNACRIQSQIDIANKLIRQQGRVGAEAGVVDTNTIYRAGMLKTYSEDNLNELRVKYREKTGELLDTSKCR